MLMVTHKTSSSEAFGRPASCHPRAATARPAHWLRAPHEDDRASARDTPPTDPMQLTERSRPAMPKGENAATCPAVIRGPPDRTCHLGDILTTVTEFAKPCLLS